MGKTLKEIDDELPNGFHDAYLEAVTINFAAKSAKLDLELWVGNLDSTIEEEREAYKGATLTIEGLEYFVIDPPDQGEVFSVGHTLWIVSGEPNDTDPPTWPKPCCALPEGVFAYWFCVRLWNSFIHVVARSATLLWDESSSG